MQSSHHLGGLYVTLEVLRCIIVCLRRYVQLPINAGMREAWEQHYQVIDVNGTAKRLTFMQAAARLGVGVFASAALREGALLQDTSLEVWLEYKPSILVPQCNHWLAAHGSHRGRSPASRAASHNMIDLC